MSLLKNVERIVREQGLIPPGAVVVVGVSGGVDSLALLHIMRTLSANKRRAFRLHTATLDHGLRGEAGAEDVRFVTAVARQWGIPVTAGREDVRALAEQQQIGLEQAARIARYNFLAAVALEAGARIIAVAHHADDQAETVLMHLLRGAGLPGLAAMTFSAPVPGHSELNLIRPLLASSRAELEAYVNERGLQPRADSTNSDTQYLRNYVRLELIPFLKRSHPQVVPALTRLAESAAIDQDFIRAHVKQAETEVMKAEGGRVLLNRERFQALHPALQRHMIVSILRSLDAQPGAGHVHIVNLVRLVQKGRIGAVTQLPGGFRAVVDYAGIVIELSDSPTLPADALLIAPDTEIPVSLPGITALPGTRWQVRAEEAPYTPGTAYATLAIRPGATAVIRARREGDRFAPPEAGGGSRKLKAWMIDQKIPQAIRSHLPLVVIDGEIAAVMLGEVWPVSAGFAVAGNDKQTISFFVDFL